MLSNENEDYDLWLTLDQKCYKPTKDLLHIETLDKYISPTGRHTLAINRPSKEPNDNILEDTDSKPFRVTGSLLNYSRSLLPKPVFFKHNQCDSEDENFESWDSNQNNVLPPTKIDQENEQTTDPDNQLPVHNPIQKTVRFDTEVVIIPPTDRFEEQIQERPEEMDRNEEIAQISVEPKDKLKQE